MTRDQLPAAAQALSDARQAQRDLADTYEHDPYDNTKIAGLHQRINYRFKDAEVSALVAIAQRLDDLGVSR